MNSLDAVLATQKRRLVVGTWITLFSAPPALWYWIYGAPSKGHELLFPIFVLVALVGVTITLLGAMQYAFASFAYPSEGSQRLARVRRMRQRGMARLEISRPTAWVMTVAMIGGIPLYLFGKDPIKYVGASLVGIAFGLVGIAIVRAGIQDGCIGGRFDVSLDRKPGLFWLTVLWIGLFSAVALIYGTGYLVVSIARLGGS
jgi:F0F1-type ATP synthase membrane subunit c/vacuolar-type H+-ATPase subunit K